MKNQLWKLKVTGTSVWDLRKPFVNMRNILKNCERVLQSTAIQKTVFIKNGIHHSSSLGLLPTFKEELILEHSR